jgi:hypothetical protein
LIGRRYGLPTSYLRKKSDELLERLFAYVFGGSINVPGTSYREFLCWSGEASRA